MLLLGDEQGEEVRGGLHSNAGAIHFSELLRRGPDHANIFEMHISEIYPYIRNAQTLTRVKPEVMDQFLNSGGRRGGEDRQQTLKFVWVLIGQTKLKSGVSLVHYYTP